MRLWTFHPKHLDSKGLVALWRESLLALAVLEGKTKGYTNHPQLLRFKNSRNPINSIASYLDIVQKEAVSRGYNFDKSKIPKIQNELSIFYIPTTKGQIEYEWEHFKRKMLTRDPEHLKRIENIDIPESHPLFTLIDGDIEQWEKVIPK